MRPAVSGAVNSELERPEGWPCPSCGAGVGVECRATHGKARPPHAPRIARAKAEQLGPQAGDVVYLARGEKRRVHRVEGGDVWLMLRGKVDGLALRAALEFDAIAGMWREIEAENSSAPEPLTIVTPEPVELVVDRFTVKAPDLFGIVHDTYSTEGELNGWKPQQGTLF